MKRAELIERLKEPFARCRLCGVRWRLRAWRPGEGRQLVYDREVNAWLCVNCANPPSLPPFRDDTTVEEWKETLDKYLEGLLKTSGGII